LSYNCIVKQSKNKTMKNYKQNYFNYILDNVNFEGYDFEQPKNDVEKAQKIYDIFFLERVKYDNRRLGTQNLLIEWLQSGQSVIDIPCYNSEILEFVEKMESVDVEKLKKESYCNKIISNYYVFMGNILMQFFKKYKTRQ
jgi:hypothetical protein